MKYTEVNNGWLVRLEKGEELIASLSAFVESEKIEGAWVNGLGGATKARLGYYNLNRKKYIFRAVKDARELVSLHGNISTIGEETALHLHGVVTDGNNRPRGGHIKELICGGTIEIYVQLLGKKLERELDSEVGLPLLKLESK